MDNSIRLYKRGEERYVAEAHRRVYTEEYRWGPAFTQYAEKVALDFAKKPENPREGLWVAEWERRPVGCVMLCETEEPDVGQLRLFLVEKDYRGCGIGSALTRTLLERAREAGYRRLTLWTASPLVDAIRHYEKLGFRSVEETANTDWSLDGDTVYEIKMEMAL